MKGGAAPKDIDDLVIHVLALRIPLLGVMAKAEFISLLLMREGMTNGGHEPPTERLPRDTGQTDSRGSYWRHVRHRLFCLG